MNSIFKQIPPPHFCFKVVCEKGMRIFGSLRCATCICIQNRLYFPFNAQQNFMNIIIVGVWISKDSDN